MRDTHFAELLCRLRVQVDLGAVVAGKEMRASFNLLREDIAIKADIWTQHALKSPERFWRERRDFNEATKRGAVITTYRITLGAEEQRELDAWFNAV